MATAEISSIPQPIAGVSPPELAETTIMTVWPSVAKYSLGRTLGQAYDIRFPDVYFFRFGRLLALLFVPVSLVLFFLRILPGIGTRYRLTNRRVIVERGIAGVEERFVDLDRFNAIEIDIPPGMSWYEAGNLIFKNGNVETFRLEGVSRPAAFRSTCMKAHLGYVGVTKALARKR